MAPATNAAPRFALSRPRPAVAVRGVRAGARAARLSSRLDPAEGWRGRRGGRGRGGPDALSRRSTAAARGGRPRRGARRRRRGRDARAHGRTGPPPPPPREARPTAPSGGAQAYKDKLRENPGTSGLWAATKTGPRQEPVARPRRRARGGAGGRGRMKDAAPRDRAGRAGGDVDGARADGGADTYWKSYPEQIKRRARAEGSARARPWWPVRTPTVGERRHRPAFAEFPESAMICAARAARARPSSISAAARATPSLRPSSTRPTLAAAAEAEAAERADAIPRENRRENPERRGGVVRARAAFPRPRRRRHPVRGARGRARATEATWRRRSADRTARPYHARTVSVRPGGGTPVGGGSEEVALLQPPVGEQALDPAEERGRDRVLRGLGVLELERCAGVSRKRSARLAAGARSPSATTHAREVEGARVLRSSRLTTPGSARASSRIRSAAPSSRTSSPSRAHPRGIRAGQHARAHARGQRAGRNERAERRARALGANVASSPPRSTRPPRASTPSLEADAGPPRRPAARAARGHGRAEPDEWRARARGDLGEDERERGRPARAAREHEVQQRVQRAASSSSADFRGRSARPAAVAAPASSPPPAAPAGGGAGRRRRVAEAASAAATASHTRAGGIGRAARELGARRRAAAARAARPSSGLERRGGDGGVLLGRDEADELERRRRRVRARPRRRSRTAAASRRRSRAAALGELALALERQQRARARRTTSKSQTAKDLLSGAIDCGDPQGAAAVRFARADRMKVAATLRIAKTALAVSCTKSCRSPVEFPRKLTNPTRRGSSRTQNSHRTQHSITQPPRWDTSATLRQQTGATDSRALRDRAVGRGRAVSRGRAVGRDRAVGRGRAGGERCGNPRRRADKASPQQIDVVFSVDCTATRWEPAHPPAQGSARAS